MSAPGCDRDCPCAARKFDGAIHVFSTNERKALAETTSPAIDRQKVGAKRTFRYVLLAEQSGEAARG